MRSSSNSDLHYRDFFENVPVGLFAISPEGRVLEANPALVQLLRYPSREDLLETSVTDFELDEADTRRVLEMLRERGEVRDLEVQLGRPDGTTVCLLTNARMARDEAGQLLHFFGTVEDITERKKAEEAARESELRFETFMDHSPLLAFIKDEEGRYEYANEPLLRFFQKERHELYGHTEYEFLPVETVGPMRAHDLAVLRDKLGMQTIEYIPDRNGEVRSFMVLKFPIIDPDERQFVGGFAVDITDRQRAQEAERRNEKRFRDLFESSPDAIFVQDLEGNILDVNPGACTICRQAAEGIVGRNMAALLSQEKLDGILSRLPKLGRGEAMHAEGTINAADGHATPVTISGSRIEYGGHPALLLQVRDVSEQKRLQEQFHQSQKMEAVGRLAGGIAHDFNNLLTAIFGYNDFILTGLNDLDPLRRNAEEVKKAAERAARLTRQLLAVSRKQTLQPRTVDLNATVSDMERMLRRLLGDEVELTTDRCPNKAYVTADPSQLEQVLIDLAVNARDAMPSGGQLIVRVSCEELRGPTGMVPDLPPGTYVLLRVTDTGIGMTDEIRERIFEPFFTTKEPGKGTGLGLATCYGIVKQSGGRILCDSEPNRGTTFSIYLPQVLGRPEPVRTSEAGGPLLHGTGTILVVEDAPGVRALTTRVLRGLGYDLLEAENGYEALSVIADCGLERIDLIVTDVTMPKMGGRELIERVRAKNTDIKVIFTSGAPGADTGLKTLFAYPGTAFLHKPFTPADLARLVHHILNPPSKLFPTGLPEEEESPRDKLRM